MKRSHAFLLSALLSLLLTSAFYAYESGAHIRVGQALAASPSVMTELPDPTDAFLTQERELQDTIAQLQTTLASMDAEYAGKIQDGQGRIEILQQAILARETSIASSQSELEALHAALSQDAMSYEQQVAILQANETQLRQTLDTTLAALTSAQNDLAIQQPTYSGSVDNGASANSDHDDDDEHDEDEHDEDGHEHEDDDD